MTKRRIALIFGWGSAVLAAALLVGHVTGVCCYEHGGEFSPDTFRGRSYQAYVVGPVRIPWYGREYETSVSRYLRSNGYLKPASGEPRWFHTVGTQVGWAFLGRSLGCSFGSPVASIAAECNGDSGDRLVVWSERRPDLAKTFWPTVVRWTQEGRCANAAALFDELKYSSDPESEEEVQEFFDRAETMAEERYGAYRVQSE